MGSISACELSASLRFFFAELLETRIVAERVPARTHPKVAGSFAIRHFEQMGQSGDGGIDIAKLRLDNSQDRFGEGFVQVERRGQEPQQDGANDRRQPAEREGWLFRPDVSEMA